MIDCFDKLQEFDDNLALIADDGERLSYRALAGRADEAAGVLGNTRRLVAVECDNSAASLCAYLGALRARHAVLPIDASLPLALKSGLLSRYRIDVCWKAACRDWESLPFPGAHPVLHPDLMLLLSTSGTTGSPKLVRLSYKNVEANAAAIAEYLALDAAERPITALPMHYSFGLSVVHSHLSVGATLLLTAHSIAARPFWDFFRAQAATSFSGVPAMYDMLRRLRFEHMELPSLRTLTQAGGRLAPESVSYFSALARQRDWRFWVMYGQTEATARMAYLSPEHAACKPGSIGRAIPGGQFRLIDVTGAPITEAGKEGELVYSGANVMMGYAEDAGDLALGDSMNGELATGDLAWRDEDGFFYISGRLKRFVKIFGNRIGLDEVETFARTKGWQAAATGKDDLLILAVIGPSSAPSDIAGEIARQYRLHHSAVRVVKVPDFPMSSAGKIQYPLLLEKSLSGT